MSGEPIKHRLLFLGPGSTPAEDEDLVVPYGEGTEVYLETIVHIVPPPGNKVILEPFELVLTCPP